MRVLVIGGGGREHALAWKIRQSPLVDQLFAAPGNAGIAAMADCVPIGPGDIVEAADFAESLRIDLTVVGPELPLNLGIADVFRQRGLRIFGPSRSASEIETSKVFAKEFMARHSIPTAPFKIFRSEAEALSHFKARSTKFPLVVKADGLAAGKGVVVAANRGEAEEAIAHIMKERAFGSAGDAVVVESCLRGTEVSFFALSDGSRVMPWPTCQDFKRALDGDAGPNTGGMGSYSPSPYVAADLFKKIVAKILNPTVAGLAKEGRPYVGFLYAGLMITDEGPMVLEYNARLGDPEAEALLPRMSGDLVPLLVAAAEGHLGEGLQAAWRREASVSVVAAAEGYPGPYATGRAIRGLDGAAAKEGVLVFQCGTKRQPNGEVQTSGGRVLAITGLGPSLESAAGRAYGAISEISFEGMRYRSDIARKAIEMLAQARRPGRR